MRGDARKLLQGWLVSGLAHLTTVFRFARK